MKWEVKGKEKMVQTSMGGEPHKNSNPSPALLQSCIKALIRVV
jgi:hypothetical protein